MLVDAVAGLQAGSKDDATKYLRFVEEHRGRDVAEAAKRRLPDYRRHPNWRDCYRWRLWGYKSTPPEPVAAKKPAPRRRR